MDITLRDRLYFLGFLDYGGSCSPKHLVSEKENVLDFKPGWPESSLFF